MIAKTIILIELLCHRTFTLHTATSAFVHCSRRSPRSDRSRNPNHILLRTDASITTTMVTASRDSSEHPPPGKVVVVGSINQDLTTYAPSLPSPGQTILGSDFIITAGGKGANQAVAASSIGVVDKTRGVHMIGRVGDDDMGLSILSKLSSKGVRLNERESRAAGVHTGVASIVVDTTSGQNTIVVAPGANMHLSKEEVKATIMNLLSGSDGYIGERAVVLVQLEIAPESALQALQCASKLGAISILNPAPAPEGWGLTNEWYSAIDILVPNETELASLSGLSTTEYVTGEGEDAMAKALLERGVRHAVIVTLGARGAMIVRKSAGAGTSSNTDIEDCIQTIMIREPIDLPCKLEPVVDSVGAGDAFCGALAAYLSRGVELEKAACMACGVASMSVRKRGAQESYPHADELPDCLRLDEGTPMQRIVEGGQESNSMPSTKKKITFVTGNKNKLAEVQRLLSSSSFAVDIDNYKLDLPELQGSPHDIAREKCHLASQQLKAAVFTEDTCLCFYGLNSLPGPYIKWFLDSLGHDGLNKLLYGFNDDRAYAQTIIAYSPGPGMEIQLFEGRTEGRIVPARGSKDFGWDPIFEPTEEEQGSSGMRKTYAEMTTDEKNAISHRGRAFLQFGEYLLHNSGARI
jgi:ribokinase/non-canonical purine NTP pyrophosphatase (RdgB/HAM1 family)